MKTYSVVKFEGLKNPTKNARELQNADLSRPTDEKRRENIERTKAELNQTVVKKTEPSFVSIRMCCITQTQATSYNSKLAVPTT